VNALTLASGSAADLASVASALLAIAALPFFGASLYLATLAMLSKSAPPRARLRPQFTRFDVLVPAYNEELGIAATVASLAALEYPRSMYRIVVVADNCDDATADRARAAGASVLERNQPDRRGKGHALAYAYEASRAFGFAEAVAVVDADTSVSPNLLDAFDAALGAGHVALQAEYGVRNAEDSWRTRLVRLGFVLFHSVRSTARERLGLSCGLRGNGMCFRSDVLRRVPHSAFSIVEDLEYGIQLGLNGIRVAYVAEARVAGDMPATSAASRTQRARWEGGRRTIVRRYITPLLRAAASRRSAVALDLALDLLVPPLSRLVAAATLGWLLAATAALAGLPAAAAVWLWSLTVAGLAAYVVRGCVMTGAGLRAMVDLAWAPGYVLWKLTVRARRSKNEAGEWVRTSRDPVRTRG
jgi:1,2-diacylglycerol 3-beta-glucosyltransferase